MQCCLGFVVPMCAEACKVHLLLHSPVHHLLDFAESPQDILREIARVTLPMGHIVLVGFNPLSFWGAW